jgi:hypothetical protein
VLWPGGFGALWSQLGEGGTTIVGAIGLAARPAGVGGAHVAATPAVWFVGADGRTGGAPFFFLRRRPVLSSRKTAAIAATARRMITGS